jgi:vacuolar-type H+-ATPase subunit F/Vma7
MEMDEARFEMIDRNKDRYLQQKRISTIIQVSGLLGKSELNYIKKQIEDMITDIERKENGK